MLKTCSCLEGVVKKGGSVVKTDFVFLDQTLSYALESQCLDTSGVICLKRKIAAMSKVVFDLSLYSARQILTCSVTNGKDIRVEIQADAGQLDQVHRLGYDKVKLKIDHKDLEQMSLSALTVIRQAGSWKMKVSLQIAGSCRYSPNELLCLCRIVRDHNIHSIVFDDQNGALNTMETYWILRDLQQQIPCRLEYCGKNNMGLATGNALGAINSGIRHIAVSVGGIAGFPALEEVLMSACCLLNFPLRIPSDMAVRCVAILNCMGQCVQPTKPIIGAHIFAHESGIHVDGISKNSNLYEPFAPETVGLSRKIIIGKHSGRKAIELKLKEMDIFIHPVVVPKVLEKVRSLAIQQKAPVSDAQLQQLVHEVAS